MELLEDKKKIERRKSVMEDAKQQSSNVVAVLIDNHRKFLSYLKGKISNPSDAEDILQAAFVKGI